MRIAGIFMGALALTSIDADADSSAPAGKSEVTFESVDRNADLRISKTEAGPYKMLIDRFAYIDSDGDGFINKQELYASLTAGTVR